MPCHATSVIIFYRWSTYPSLPSHCPARMNTARSERDRNKDYSEDVYNALREAEADFDCLDAEGNSPLHLG